MLLSQIIIRLLLASFLGALIGLDRERHNEGAGLRTNLLVSLGSALFTILSVMIASMADIADPGRIASQIITGIGFLGAGTIMKSGFSVRGITTAASIWVSAGIGMAAGAGYFSIAIIACALALGALMLLKPIAALFRRDSYRILTIQTPIATNVQNIIHVLRDLKDGIHVDYFEFDREAGVQRVRIFLTLTHRGDTDDRSAEIVGALTSAKIRFSSLHWHHRE